MSLPKQSDIKNWILTGLSEADFALVQPRLERVALKPGDMLEVAGAPPRHVFFVSAGLISLLAPLEHGERLEVGHVGPEGAAGVHAVLGADHNTSEMMAQSEGWMYRADVMAMRPIVEQSRGLRHALVRFSNALHVQVAQTAACNGSHDVSQRLARWLLMAQDRLGGDVLTLTHEVMSLMLGVTRPGVTIAAGALQKAGLIQYSRGKITITDRAGLEQAACECYGMVAAYYRAELGTASAPRT